MKPAFAALIAICIATNVGCRSFSSSCCHENQWDCVRGRDVWMPGTPGGTGCEGCSSCGTGILSGPDCGCERCGTDVGCGIESTGCASGCSTGRCCSGKCPNNGCQSESCPSESCRSGGSQTYRNRGSVDGESFALDDNNFAPIVNGSGATSMVITDGDGYGRSAGVMMAGRGQQLAGGRGAMRGSDGACPGCGGMLGAGGLRNGCGRCGLGRRGIGAGGMGPVRNAAAHSPHVQAMLQKTANKCENGLCNLPPGPETGAVHYPYYTTRGPRDFLSPNPSSIGP